MRDFIFLGTTPWTPQRVNSTGEVGEGTDYPFATTLAETVAIYWHNLRFILTVEATHETYGSFSISGSGPRRCDEAYQLIFNQHGTATAGGEIGFLSVNAGFDLHPESKHLNDDMQYLFIRAQFSLSGSGAPNGGSVSVNGPGVVVGQANICGAIAPLYGSQGHSTGWLSASLNVTGELWV